MPAPAPRPDDPRFCTECGWNTPGFAPPTLPWWHVRRLLPAAVAIALLSTIFLFPHRYSWSRGNWIPRFVEPAVTVRDLAEIAEGRSPGTGLLEALDRELHREPDEFGGGADLLVSAQPSTGSRKRLTSVGWPSPWRYEARQSYYRDAPRREGKLPVAIDPTKRPDSPYSWSGSPAAAPRPAWAWSFPSLVHRPDPAASGGDDVMELYDLRGPASTFGAWLALSCVLALLLRAGSAIARRPISRPRRLLAAAVIALVPVAVLACRSSSIESPIYTTLAPVQIPGTRISSYPGFALPTYGDRGLLALREAPDGPARAARLILEALGPQAQNPDLLLAVWPRPTVAIPDANGVLYPAGVSLFRLDKVVHYRRPEVGTPEPVLPSWRWRTTCDLGGASLAWASTDPLEPVRTLRVEWASVGLYAAAFGVVALADLWLVLPLIAWRARRRRRRGRCPRCDHPLVLAATTPPAPLTP